MLLEKVSLIFGSMSLYHVSILRTGFDVAKTGDARIGFIGGSLAM